MCVCVHCYGCSSRTLRSYKFVLYLLTRGFYEVFSRFLLSIRDGGGVGRGMGGGSVFFFFFENSYSVPITPTTNRRLIHDRYVQFDGLPSNLNTQVKKVLTFLFTRALPSGLRRPDPLLSTVPRWSTSNIKPPLSRGPRSLRKQRKVRKRVRYVTRLGF